jgi:hypothetical protein
MSRTLINRLISGIALLLVVQGNQAFAQNDKKDKQDPPAKTDKSDKSEEKDTKKGPKLTYVGTYVGKLVKLEEDGFKMEIDVPVSSKKTVKQTVDILLNDDVKVRMPVDVEFDDKGRPKRMKKDPNDKDSKLGGIKGAREDLAHNQEIVVKVSRLPNRKLIATVVTVIKKP